MLAFEGALNLQSRVVLANLDIIPNII